MTTLDYRLSLVTAPAAEPILAADVRTWGRITSTTGEFADAVINRVIKEVRELAEAHTDLAFITQTWAMYLDAFPEWEICLPKPPWQSITSVKYYAPGETSYTTLDSGEYLFDSVGGRLTPDVGTSWPATEDRINAVEIKWVSGYGSAGSSCPAMVLTSLLEMAEDRLKNRGGMYRIPSGTAEKLLALWPGRI